jgi:hypothetical protein
VARAAEAGTAETAGLSPFTRTRPRSGTRTGQGEATMTDEGKVPIWWVTVNGDRRGPFRDRASAEAVARALKQINPSRDVAIVNPHGRSKEVER